MKVVHADVYTLGSELSFSGHKSFMVLVCGLCTFAHWEPLREMNSTSFSEAIMKILLSYGLCHTIIVDKDSKFMGVFKETIKLLQFNLHVASGGNHDPILNERVFRYVNKGMRVITNSLGSNRSSSQAIGMLLYAYNSAPVTGTDISRSLIMTGREFHFPIDYSTNEHTNLTFGVESIQNFAKEQEKILSCSREIFRTLIQETRAWHREYINSSRPDPKIYNIDDIVLARREVQSNASKGRVAKSSYKFTGPWKVIESLPGGSYKIQHTIKTDKEDKKHSSHLSPLPKQLIPFPPLNGPDTSYQQLHKKYASNPFKAAGIEGFKPVQPWKTSNLLTIKPSEYLFPNLAELNAELDIEPCNKKPDTDTCQVLEDRSSINNFIRTDHPSEHNTNYILLGTTKSLSMLIARIIKSEDKLFFINHSYEGRKEWNLVQLNLIETINQNPLAFSDGKFLVEYFIPHPDDDIYSHHNQRFWKEYHARVGAYQIHENYHLVKPSNNSDLYCKSKSLTPFRKWTHLNHPDTFIHGPFEFATINGRKTRDRISNTDFEILLKAKNKYDNEPPVLISTQTSFHIDTAFHTELQAQDVTNKVQVFNAMANLDYR